MGAKTAVVAFCDTDPAFVLRAGDAAEPAAARELVERLFPGRVGGSVGPGYLADAVLPGAYVYAGAFSGLEIVCGGPVVQDLPADFGAPPWKSERKGVYLHTMQSAVDTAMFGVWRDGELLRAVGVSPEHRPWLVGEPFPFEAPWWAGEYRDGAVAGLPFHPMAFGEAALCALFGFVSEGAPGAAPVLDPFQVTLEGFRVD
ncbi:hypothetical protein J0910_12960 [Nocardiopsis sp. CNT-189]|uniref:DUF6928 family protein n=1 Tax=Nocardiopsis oceanisediminis TaxID=2816862 RepID=UPI003B2BA371